MLAKILTIFHPPDSWRSYADDVAKYPQKENLVVRSEVDDQPPDAILFGAVIHLLGRAGASFPVLQEWVDLQPSI